MTKVSVKRRKTLLVEVSLHNRIKALAKRKGMLLNRLVDDLIESGIAANGGGSDVATTA